ncbi:hypothetical protein EV179_006381 [Coemansia sp. RSA 487]|nr:hypothetical protein EV179_006381 [Coemansia sp. RSA 487]
MYKDKFKCNEADSMRIARNIGGVRCPRVVASGMIEGHTYILMEWIDGTNLGDVWENLTGENKQVVLRQIDHEVGKMKNLSADFIGNARLDVGGNIIGGYISDGNIYEGRSREISPRVYTMDEWQALLGVRGVATDQKFVFSHNDLGPWNVIVDRDSLNVRSIIDWEYAGYYPEYYEKSKANKSLVSNGRN